MKSSSEKDVLDKFSEAQLAKLKLRKNRYEPMAWRQMNKYTLFRLLKAEVAELEHEIEQGNVELTKDEAVDVANLACFLWDISK